jgi:hypothetical protein
MKIEIGKRYKFKISGGNCNTASHNNMQELAVIFKNVRSRSNSIRTELGLSIEKEFYFTAKVEDIVTVKNFVVVEVEDIELA